jgi:dienelactone hydrolase
MALPTIGTTPARVRYCGTDPAARADALQRVPAFFARYLGN